MEVVEEKQFKVAAAEVTVVKIVPFVSFDDGGIEVEICLPMSGLAVEIFNGRQRTWIFSRTQIC